MSSSKNKSQFLGMPFGTANARLRKSILFRLVQRCGEDICFRCGNQIEDIDDLSIEHKRAWEGRDPKLFWDLDNIAFSHLRCNVPDYRRVADGLRIARPNGYGRCSTCKQNLPPEQMTKSRRYKSGLSYVCLKCGAREVSLRKARRRQTIGK